MRQASSPSTVASAAVRTALLPVGLLFAEVRPATAEAVSRFGQFAEFL